MQSTYSADHTAVSSPTSANFDNQEKQGNPTEAGTRKDRFNAGTSSLAERIGANPILTWGLRALQFISAIVALALASRSLDKFYTSERRMRYTAFVGTFTILYLIVLMVLSFVSPSMISIGAVMIMELLCCIFWLCSWIALAARYSGFSCHKTYGNLSNSGYDSSGYSGSDYSGSDYSGSDYSNYGSVPGGYITGCRSSKGAIAFAVFSFVLFALSSILLFYNVIRRLLPTHKDPAYYFQLGAGNSSRLNKPCLAFDSNYVPDDSRFGSGYNQYDVENGTGNPYPQGVGGETATENSGVQGADAYQNVQTTTTANEYPTGGGIQGEGYQGNGYQESSNQYTTSSEPPISNVNTSAAEANSNVVYPQTAHTHGIVN